MTSTLKHITAAIPSYRQIGNELNAGNITLIDADFTDNEYQVSADQYAKIIAVSHLVTSDKTIKLPTGSATMDGFYIRVLNDAFYNITIKPDSAVAVWNSGNGYGIDLPNKGTLVKLMYLHSLGKWIITEKTGGKVLVEGLKLFVPMDKLYAWDNLSSVSYSGVEDKTGRHYGYATGDLQTEMGVSPKFPPSCFRFDGSGDYIQFYDSPDWDIFGNQIGHKTIAFWVYLNTLSTVDRFIMQYQDLSNKWACYKHSDSGFYAYYSGHTNGVNLHGGSFSAEIWTHAAIVVNGSDIGLYINGQQVAYDGDWDTGTLNGGLSVGWQANRDSDALAGRMQDLHISYSNPYNANPQSDNSDSFIVPAAPFEGVMK